MRNDGDGNRDNDAPYDESEFWNSRTLLDSMLKDDSY